MVYWYYNSHLNVWGERYSTKTYDSAMTFPFIYGGITYDMNNRPYKMTVQRASGSYAGRCGNINIYPVSGTSLLLSKGATIPYSKYGYNRIINSNVELSDDYLTRLETSTISGKFRFKSSVLATTPAYLASTSIPVNVSINGKAYKCIVFPAGKKWYVSDGGELNTPNASVGGFGILPQNFSEPEDFTFFTTSETSGTLKSEYADMVWDFGDLPQEVPKTFVDWINQNAVTIYPYTYTIKNSAGNTILAQLLEAPSMNKALLSVVGNQKNLTLTGVNGTEYTLTWSSTTPEGKQFLGLSTSPESNRVILPTGVEASVSWTGDLTLYESYGTYRPPATVFDINLYQNSAEVTRVDKEQFLVGVGTLSGALREECSMLTPSIVYQSADVPTFNYVYIPIFNRYYFVTSLSSVSKNVWRMELNCDVLMTYKEQIFQLQGVIGRQETDFNPLLVDNELPTQNNPIVEVIDIPSDAFNTKTTGIRHNYVITVIGA